MADILASTITSVVRINPQAGAAPYTMIAYGTPTEYLRVYCSTEEHESIVATWRTAVDGA